MLLTYLPLIMLGQLLSLSLLLNIFLFRQNRKLTKNKTVIEKISKENFFSEYIDNISTSPAEDLTLFIPQPIFKVEPTPFKPTTETEKATETIASTIELPIIKPPTEKSTFDDIHRLLNEISQIENKMGLKNEKEKEAS